MTRTVGREDQIIAELPKIIDWMADLGLPARNSRYARYEKHINDFHRSGSDVLSKEGERLFKEMTLAYRECIDIYLVYKSLGHVSHSNFVSTLSNVVSGKDVPDLEVAGASRNYLFELLVAARFHLAGYVLDFDNTNDIVARRDGLVVRTECKRLTSVRQLKKRIDEAARQLAIPIAKAGEKMVGLIYLDVSSCVLPDVSQIVETANDAENEVKRAVSRFIKINTRMLETLNQKHIDVSYATCLIGTLPIWDRNFVMHTSASTAVRAAENLSDIKFDELQKVLGGFDKTFTGIFPSDS